jgi:hypothetical protein
MAQLKLAATSHRKAVEAGPSSRRALCRDDNENRNAKTMNRAVARFDDNSMAAKGSATATPVLCRGAAVVLAGIEERSFVAALLWMTAKGGWGRGRSGGGAGSQSAGVLLRRSRIVKCGVLLGRGRVAKCERAAEAGRRVRACCWRISISPVRPNRACGWLVLRINMRVPSCTSVKLSHRTQLYHFGFGRGSAADYIQSPVLIHCVSFGVFGHWH